MMFVMGRWASRAYEFINAAWGLEDYVKPTLSAQHSLLESAWRAPLAIVLVAAMFSASLRSARYLLPRAGLPLRWAATLAIGMWISTMAFHLLRLVGLFKLWAAVLAALALLVAARFYKPEVVPLIWTFRRELRAARALWKLVRRSRYGSPTCLLAGLAAVYALRALIIPPLGWDTLTYHGPRAAIWVQSGRFTFPEGPGPLDLYRYFFSGTEVLSAWAMLPFYSDVFVNTSTVFQWLGVFLGAWALARGCGLKEPYAAASAGAAAFIPTMHLEIGTAYTEVALCATLLTGAALALEALRNWRPTTALLAAAVLGLPIGIKLLGAPPALVALLVIAARNLVDRTRSIAARGSWLFAFTIIAIAPTLPWLLHAWYESGYPLGAMPVEVLGIKLGELSPSLRWYQDRNLVPYVWDHEKAAALSLFASVGTNNEALGSLSLLPILMLPVGAVSLLRARPLAGVLVVGTALPPLLVHFSASLTTPRLLWSVSVSRYLLMFVTMATIVGAVWCRRNSRLAEFYRRILVTSAVFYALFFVKWGWSFWEYRELVVTAGALVGSVSLLSFASRFGIRALVPAALSVLIAFCYLLHSRHELMRVGAFSQSFAMHPWPQYWAGSLPMIDDPSSERIVAVTAGESQPAHEWFFYPFFGTRLQNRIEYVPATIDGHVEHHGPYGRFAFSANREAWTARLRERGVTHVFSFAPRSMELQWMDEQPAVFRRLSGDYSWGLFELIR